MWNIKYNPHGGETKEKIKSDLNPQFLSPEVTPMDNVHAILQRVPIFASRTNVTVTELTGGITNKNYKIGVGNEAFVVRLGGNDTEFLGINRKTEYECTRAASLAGVGPETIAYLEPEGYLVTRFIFGIGISADQIGSQTNIQRVVGSMKLYHAIEHFPGSFSPFRVAEEYAKTAHSFNVKLPQKMDWYLERSSEIEKAMYGREPLKTRPCHNDLLNANFIDDGTRIRIIDWEYGGMGDIFFDLGNFAVQHDFNDKQDEMLLKAYFDSPTDSQRAHLKLMKIMSDLRESMWGMVQKGISKLDFDYIGYAEKFFARYEAGVRRVDYREWLETV